MTELPSRAALRAAHRADEGATLRPLIEAGIDAFASCLRSRRCGTTRFGNHTGKITRQ